MRQTLEEAAEEYLLNPPILDSGILKSIDNERRAFSLVQNGRQSSHRG